MSRAAALAGAAEHFDSGAFIRDLARRVAIRTESQSAESGPHLRAYLADELAPSLAALDRLLECGLLAGLDADVGDFKNHCFLL